MGLIENGHFDEHSIGASVTEKDRMENAGLNPGEQGFNHPEFMRRALSEYETATNIAGAVNSVSATHR